MKTIQNSEIKIGTVLVAKDECRMGNALNGDNTPALIIGKEYPVKYIHGNLLAIESETDKPHYFHLEDKLEPWTKYFNIKKEETT